MSGRFVSSGTISSSGEKVLDADGAPPPREEAGKAKNAAQWDAVEKELEAERQRREQHRRQVAEGGEKSLYEILQDNKAAKQAAFEEQTKVRNQFRALDDDEIEFLDEVRLKQRKEEDALRRETEEGLKAFRQAQKGGGEAKEETVSGSKETELTTTDAQVEDWGVGKKRKRLKEREVKGIKRKTSESEAPEVQREEKKEETSKQESKAKPEPQVSSKEAKPSLGLVGYGSDSDDD